MSATPSEWRRRISVLAGALALSLPLAATRVVAAPSTSASQLVAPLTTEYVGQIEDGDGPVRVEPTGVVWEWVYCNGMVARTPHGRHLGPAKDIGFDAAGYGYVLTETGVDVYAPGVLDSSVANPKPVRVVAGAATGLDGEVGTSQIEVAANGSFMVKLAYQQGQLVFPAGAVGNARPRAYSDFAFSSTAATGRVSALLVGGAGVAVYSWSPSGAIKLSRTIAGTRTGLASLGSTQVAMDNFGNIYAAGAGTITVFAPGVSGNVAPRSTVTVKRTKQDTGGGAGYEAAVPGSGGYDYLAVGRNREVYTVGYGDVPSGFPGMSWFQQLPALVGRAASSVAVGSLTAPTSSSAGSMTASVSGSAVGGWLSGNVRFLLSSKGRATQVITRSLPSGGWAPRTSTVTAALPKLAKGSWTLTIAYGGNGDFAPATVSQAVTVK